MSILCDKDLIEKLKQFIPVGRDRALVNPGSIDLRIGTTMKVEVSGGTWRQIDLSRFSETNPYSLEPGEFVLVATLETVKIPSGFCGEIKLKSTRAREGYDHAVAGFIDSGWHGVITLEVRNATRFQTLCLYPGMRFVQLIIHTMTSKVLRPYAGRYQGAQCVEGPKVENPE